MAVDFTTLFVDLDDTVYPSSTGLWGAIRRRMDQYMVERLHMSPDEVHTLRPYYFQTYGTTLRGLQIHHQVDAHEFLAYVHDLPLKEYLLPAPELREILLSIPQKRWIFTNADVNHARRVLSVLELEGVFEGIIDIFALEYACKPNELAYQRAMRIAGARTPAECVLIDDSKTNLDGAKMSGFTTLLIHPDGSQEQCEHIILPELQVLPRIMPELWQVRDDGHTN